MASASGYREHVATYLDRILAEHRAAAEADSRSLTELAERCSRCGPARGFGRALAGGDQLAVIAEIKRRSPSKKNLALHLDPTSLALAYEAGGAACLSVLTEPANFGGSPEDLQTARAAVQLPVIRKDFTVSLHDIFDARLMGADCVLLIVAALNDDELASFAALATELGLDVLLETHDEVELQRALAASPTGLIGVNQRDLATFEVDQERAVRVAEAIPASRVAIAESGVRGVADAEALAGAGYQAVLVGEYLVTSPDPTLAIEQLRVSLRN
jgi:indole-3-glycerol phosphate synthase